MARAEIRIKVDRDWLALNAYRMALERIADYEAAPWEADGEEARMLARHVLEEFPGSFQGRGGLSQ